MKKPLNLHFIHLLYLSIPLIFSNLVNASSSLISMYLLSKLSIDALAAGAIITSTYGLIMMMVISILYSISMMVGKMIGANQSNIVGAIVFAGCFIAMTIGVPITMMMLNMMPIFKLLGQPHQVSLLAASYFKGIAIGFIPSLVVSAIQQFFMGAGRTNIIFYLSLLSVVINTALSYAFIFGFQFIPALGMLGGGLANGISAWVLLSLTIIILFFNPIYSKYKIFHKENIHFKFVPLLLKIGFPISVQFTAEILSFSVLTYLMGIIGTDALGAQQIALQCSMISIMIVMAISQSSSILISQAVGKGELQITRRIAYSAQMLGFVFTLSIAFVYSVAPNTLISYYLNMNDSTTSHLVSLTKTILLIAAFTQIFDSARNITAGLLRGFGDTKSSMWTSIISCWIIGIPLASLLAFYFHLGAIGIRLGIMFGIIFGCIHLMKHFYTYHNNNLKNALIYVK